MSTSIKLGYLVFGVRSKDRWANFLQGMLGLPAPVSNVDGSLGFRLDEARQRLIVCDDRSDDMLALGIECPDEAGLQSLLERLERAGIASHAGTAALCTARRVRRLQHLADPAGNRVELFVGPESAGQPFASASFPSGFRTGELGLGHAVLVSDDLEAMERFYVDVLGFSVTERLRTRLGPRAMNGVFLHCNQRHHSLALFDLPVRKRLHHFMVEANQLGELGMAFERARNGLVPLSLELGQHPSPDGTVSFYGETPSGFDFEIGVGGSVIEPRGWTERRTNVTSTWGHRPRLRLKLKMAAQLVLAGRPRAGRGQASPQRRST